MPLSDSIANGIGPKYDINLRRRKKKKKVLLHLEVGGSKQKKPQAYTFVLLELSYNNEIKSKWYWKRGIVH